MKLWIFRLFILVVAVGITATAHARSAFGDAVSDVFYDSVYKSLAPIEKKLINDRFGVNIVSCDLTFKSRWDKTKTITRNRPGLLICVYEHLIQQMQNPDLAIEITAWAKFSNNPTRFEQIPFRVVWKTTKLPDKTAWDYLTLGFSYYQKIVEAASRWKDCQITLESKIGPLPLDLFVSENSNVDILYKTFAKREPGVTERSSKISKVALTVRTALPQESVSAACETLDVIEGEQSRVCVEISVYGADKNDPSIKAIAESNWALRKKNSKQFHLSMQVNPDADQDIPFDTLKVQTESGLK